MEALAAFVAGAAAKIYDDGVDMNIITNEYHKKILETLQCFLLGALSVNNFTFSVILYVGDYLNYLANPNAFKEPYENSLLVLYPIFLILSFSKREYLNSADVKFFCLLVGFLFFEPLIIKEDKSPRKFIHRLFTLLLFIAFLLLDIKLSSGIYFGLLYGLGYFLISTIFQGYHVSNMTFSEFKYEAIKGVNAVLVGDLNYAPPDTRNNSSNDPPNDAPAEFLSNSLKDTSS